MNFTMPPEGLRYVGLWRVLGWGLVGLIVYLSLTPAPPEIGLSYSNYGGHLLAYAVLMFWFVQLYERRLWWSFALGFMLLGFVLELLQGLLGYRHFDLLDLAADCLGVLLGWALGLTPLTRLLQHVDARLARSL